MSKHKKYLLFLIVFYTIHFLLVKNLPNFWDNIYFSAKVSAYFLNTNFSSFLLPEKLDASHLPFFGYFLAIVYKIFGTKLIVGHILMFPFLVGNGFLFFKILQHFKVAQPFLISLLFLFEPTYLAQSTMVSLEICLLTFFLAMLYAILKNKNWLIVFASIFLALISLRGAILVFCLFIFHCILNSKKLNYLNILKLYVPSALLFLGFYFFKYYEVGYFLSPENSSWGSSVKLNSAMGFVKQIAITIWRFIDFGRITIFAAVVFLLYFYKKSKHNFSHQIINICYLFLTITFVLTVINLLIQNPVLHRYFMPNFLVLIILFGLLLTVIKNNKLKYLLVSLVFVSFIFGHKIIYKNNLAQGWDASLAHLPYFKLKEEMNNYLTNKNIDIKNVVTTFPLINNNYYSNFVGNRNDFINYNSKTFKKYKYFLQSNIMNDITDEDLMFLKSKCKVEATFAKNGVYINLYKIKNK